MGSQAGAVLAAARRRGLDPDEVAARRAIGEKWCTPCDAWHPLAAFGVDRSRGDGLTVVCSAAKARRDRERYTPRARPAPGRRYQPARDGDKQQARRRVNHLVEIGVWPNPNTIACVDCGHLGDDRRHEHDHHRGYAAEHHETVEVVCSCCHHARERGRRHGR